MFSILNNYTGKSLLLDFTWQSSIHLSLETDSAKSCGYAAVFQNKHWFFGTFPQSLNNAHITLLEFIPVVIAIHLWANALSNKCVSLATDNWALVFIINKQTSRDKRIMSLVRKMVLCLLTHNIYLKAHHISSSQNALADSISRFNFQRAFKLQPLLNSVPSEVPPHLTPSALLQNTY